MVPTTPNSAATEHANVDNTEPREGDATERVKCRHDKMIGHAAEQPAAALLAAGVSAMVAGSNGLWRGRGIRPSLLNW